MALKFSYIDVDEDVYMASGENPEDLVEPFDPDTLKSDPKKLLNDIVKETKDFIKQCKNKDYYDADRWTSLNTKWSPILEKIRKDEIDPKSQKQNQYYENEIRPVMKSISQYATYLRKFHKQNTERYLLAQSFNPKEKNEKYTQWIINELKEQRIQSTDKESVKKYLEIYDGFPEDARTPLSELTIHTLFDYLEEQGLVSLNTPEGTLKKQQKLYLDGKMKDCRIIFKGEVEGDEWTVYQITSVSAAMAMANNTAWCTIGENHANTYLSMSAKCLVAFFKNGRPYSQLEPSSGEFKDKKDVQISTSFRPPYRLQDNDLYQVVKAITDPLFTEIQPWNNHGLPFSMLVLPADPAPEVLLDQLKNYPADEIHKELKQRIIKRFKILEPKIFEQDAPYMITEPYMRSWGESEEGRNPELEQIIKDKPNWALSYACNVIKGGWADGEEAIFRGDSWDDYLRYALKIPLKDFLAFKLKLKVETFSDLSLQYNSLVEFCNVLTENQRENLEPEDYFISLAKQSESADLLLLHALEKYDKPNKFLNFKIDGGKITEIENLEVNSKKEYKITNLTQEVYDQIQKNELSDAPIHENPSALKEFIKFYSSPKFSSKLESTNVDLVNASPKNGVFEKKFFGKDFFSREEGGKYGIDSYYFKWVHFIKTLNNKDNNRRERDLTPEEIRQIGVVFNIKFVGKSEYYANRLIDLSLDYRPFDLALKYFIFSDYYSKEVLVKLFNTIEKRKSSFRTYAALLIEKAVKCKETSPDFWTAELINFMEQSVGRAVFSEKRPTRDKEYVKSLIENVPELASALKKLFDPDYTRAVTRAPRDKKDLENLNFADVLPMLDNVKVPSRETVKSSFDKLSEDDRKKIFVSFSKSTDTTFPNLIAKFYNKNIGFIELFDLLDLDRVITPDSLNELDYLNPFMLTLIGGRGSQQSVLGPALYLNKVKDLPDFKTWIKKQKANNKTLTLLYDEEEAQEPNSTLIEDALDDLDNLLYTAAGEGGARWRDTPVLQDPSVKLIVSHNLNIQQLKTLRRICPGLFVQYINLYRFSKDKQTFIDDAILNLVKQTRIQGDFLQTYAPDRKLAPGKIIDMLLPYLTAHHPLMNKNSLDGYTVKLVETIANGGILGGYTTSKILEARIIREIKRFNK